LSSLRSTVVLQIGETLVTGGCPLERAAVLRGLPLHDLLDLFRQFEILIGYALRRMILQPDFDPGVGRRDIRMMPRGFRKVPDRVDHHQSALPAVGAIAPSNPAVFEVPMRQLGLEARFDLGIRVGPFFAAFRHGITFQKAFAG
jgi:hypothetical protein